jgi:N-acetylmuramoyl-L-alanine amidase
MAYKIALDAGHGYNTPGKRCDKSIDANQTREWWLSNRIVVKVEEKLYARYIGFDLLRTDDRTGKTDVSRKKRYTAANNFKADILLSIHANAAGKKFYGGGIVLYVCKGLSEKGETRTLQKKLYDKLIARTGLKGNRATPLGQYNYDMVYFTKMPAILCELGFMDSVIDTPIILTEEFADQCAEAIVELLAEHGKLAKKPEPKPEPKPDTSYKVRVTTANLNIRVGAGTNYAKAGSIKDRGVYTIVEERAGKGATVWGRLKSGAGWISLDYTKRI